MPDPGACDPRRGGATGAAEVSGATGVGIPGHAIDRGIGALPRPGADRLGNSERRSSWLRDQVASRPVDSVGLTGCDVWSCIGPRHPLVVSPHHFEAALQLVPRWWGVLLFRGGIEGVSLDPFRPAAENPDQDPRALADAADPMPAASCHARDSHLRDGAFLVSTNYNDRRNADAPSHPIGAGRGGKAEFETILPGPDRLRRSRFQENAV